MNEYCGVGLLNTDKVALVEKVKLLECQVVFLNHRLDNAIKEIERLKRENKRT